MVPYNNTSKYTMRIHYDTVQMKKNACTHRNAGSVPFRSPFGSTELNGRQTASKWNDGFAPNAAPIVQVCVCTHVIRKIKAIHVEMNVGKQVMGTNVPKLNGIYGFVCVFIIICTDPDSHTYPNMVRMPSDACRKDEIENHWAKIGWIVCDFCQGERNTKNVSSFAVATAAR